MMLTSSFQECGLPKILFAKLHPTCIRNKVATCPSTEYSYAAFQVFLHQRILKRYTPTDRKSSLYDIKTMQYKEWFSRFADMRSKLADSKQLGFFMNAIH
ncbi:hypothetical protein SAMN03159297_03977 [Pseudomonas sp. NFACC45]|nr:hypothetical protein SAMN03159297_03977 [Pseudomonas sp. NFACC45]